MQSDNILHSCLGVSLGSFAGGEVEKPLAEKDEALSFIFCNQARLQKSGWSWWNTAFLKWEKIDRLN